MKVILTEEALSRLEDVVDFMLFEQEIPYHIVERQNEKLLLAALNLGKAPYQGRKEPFLAESTIGYRRIVVDHIKIIYYVDENNLYVTDFFDSRQHPDKMKD
ncbi:MAG TPA: hypothetical protein DCE41_06715 [Cytophagales bacterium]|nr:hypothetical protein [Cytophagales bacterium]